MEVEQLRCRAEVCFMAPLISLYRVTTFSNWTTSSLPPQSAGGTTRVEPSVAGADAGLPPKAQGKPQIPAESYKSGTNASQSRAARD